MNAISVVLIIIMMCGVSCLMQDGISVETEIVSSVGDYETDTICVLFEDKQVDYTL